MSEDQNHRNSVQTYPIGLRKRPRRVAFLVDLTLTDADRVLDAILDFNLESWGGRYNPIIPLVNDAVPSTYTGILDAADPDAFYCYGDVNHATVDWLHNRFAPIHLLGHSFRGTHDAYRYTVRLSDQAGIHGYVKNIRELFPPMFRTPEPCLLNLDGGEETQLSPFFRWNIGYSRWNHFAVRDYGIRGCKPASLSDADLLRLVNAERNFLWQTRLCADAPIEVLDENRWNRPFLIFFGDDLFNRVAYWNDALATAINSPIRGGLEQMWVPPNLLEDGQAAEQLISLIRRHVFEHGSKGQRGIKVISFDEDSGDLDHVCRNIVGRTKSIHYFAGSARLKQHDLLEYKFTRNTAQLIPHKENEVHYAIGRSAHLPFESPTHIEENSDDQWMLDVHILDATQDLGYANAEPWWRLPRKAAFGTLFNFHQPHRVVQRRDVSFEVSSRQRLLHFDIPMQPQVFRHLLSPTIHYGLAGDLRSTLKHSENLEVVPSDKGMYLSGIFALCGSARDAMYLFEHPFWRGLLLRLAGGQASEQVAAKLTSDIKRKLPLVASGDNLEEINSWLAQELIIAAKGIRSAQPSLTQREFEEARNEYITGLQPNERPFREPKHLPEALADLLRSEVLFHGSELQCPYCISTLWYSVSEMRKVVVCRGCQRQFPLPPEPIWAYRLNELMTSGIKFHGLVPVIRTLARIAADIQDCFLFTPSVKFVRWDHDGSTRDESEIDLAWIKDGVFGIAEVKNSTKLFTGADYTDLADTARRVHADRVIIAAPEGNDGELEKGRARLSTSLGDDFEVVAWGPKDFQASPSWIV